VNALEGSGKQLLLFRFRFACVRVFLVRVPRPLQLPALVKLWRGLFHEMFDRGVPGEGAQRRLSSRALSIAYFERTEGEREREERGERREEREDRVYKKDDPHPPPTVCAWAVPERLFPHLFFWSPALFVLGGPCA